MQAINSPMFLPNPVNQVSSGKISSDIDKYPGGIPDARSDILKHKLTHLIIWTDIEHIDCSIWMKNDIKYCSGHTADQIQNGAADKFTVGVFFILTCF